MKITASITAIMIALTAVLSSCSSTGAVTQETDTTTTSSGTETTASDSGGENGDKRVYIEGTKFLVNGEEIWFNGANTPWDNWNDFGGNFDYDFWDEHFAALNEIGVNSSRVWINCNGMTGVRLNKDGAFSSVSELHWEDLDSLFELAEKHEIYIMATLLSFDHFKDSNTGYENWRKMINSSENIDSFVEGYVIPFVQRYDDNDYLFSIDLMNEPDWVHENEECGKQSWDNISNYFARSAAAIHENSDVLVTVGFGMIKYNSASFNGNMASDEYLQKLSGNKNSYLDYYSPHYYSWERQWFGYPFNNTPTGFKLDGTKPAVIGECAASDKEPLTERYEGAYTNGWNGVYAWTSNGIDDCGGFEDVKPAAEHMVSLAGDKIK